MKFEMDHTGQFRIGDGDPSSYDGIAVTQENGETYIAVSHHFWRDRDDAFRPHQIYRLVAVPTEMYNKDDAPCTLWNPEEPCIHRS